MATSMHGNFPCETSKAGVVEFVELERHGETVLGGELLDELAHLAVTYDCQLSMDQLPSFNTSGSSSAKNSSCSRDRAEQVRLGHHQADVE